MECDASPPTKPSMIVQDFAGNTTMHGMTPLSRSKSTIVRAIWCIIIIFVITMFFNQFVQCFKKYLSYSTTTDVQMTRGVLEFPDISLCNMRHLHVTVLKRFFEAFGQTQHPAEIIAILKNTNFTTQFEREYVNKMIKFIPVWGIYQYSHGDMFREIFSRTNLLGNFNYAHLKLAAVQPAELAIRCRWGHRHCNFSQVTLFNDAYFYNCLTFHPPEELALIEGVDNGWSNIALIGSEMVDWGALSNKFPIDLPGLQEYQHPLAGNEGARVVIHAQGTRPFPSSEGFDVPPGFSASMGVKMRKNVFLGQPYGNCTKRTYDDSYPRYTATRCYKKCILDEMVKKCQCMDTTMISSVDEILPDVPFCSYVADPPEYCSDVTKFPPIDCTYVLQEAYDRMLCAKDVEHQMAKDPLLMDECRCFSPCNDVHYDVSFSLSGWPAAQDADKVYQSIVEPAQTIDEKLALFNISQEKIDFYRPYFTYENRFKSLKSFVKVNVYLAESKVILTSESPAYQQFQLLADVGGQMGLWIGMSVITVAEILQLIGHLIAYVCCNRKTKVRQSETVYSGNETNIMYGNK